MEARIRAVQQSAIAELGRRLLTSGRDTLSSARDTFDRACELVMNGLGVEFSAYLELSEDGKNMLVRAGHRWPDETPRRIPVESSEAGFTISSGEPVIVSDYETETRFSTAANFALHGIRSGLTVPVTGSRKRFGVLSAQTRSERRFDDADVHFVESLASILAEALERDRSRTSSPNAIATSFARNDKVSLRDWGLSANLPAVVVHDVDT